MPEEEKVYMSMYSRNAELYHHGILGMKWGRRNGPPYPLGSDVSTGSRLKKIFSRDKGGEEVKKKEEAKNESDNAKSLKEEAKNESDNTKSLKKEEKKRLKESRRDTVTSKAVKRAKGMSDEELKAAVNRLNFEKQYANLEKDLAELSKKNPTLGQKVKSSIKKTLKEQLSKTGKTVLNSVTSEINKKISETIKDKMDEKFELGDYKPKKDKQEDTETENSSSHGSNPSAKEKEPSKVKQAFEEYKEAYKEGWTDWNVDSETGEQKMNRKEREAAAEVKRTAEYNDAKAEAYRQMYDDPNYEQYKDTIFRQYAQATAEADKYREENQEIIDKLDRQFPNYKSKKKKR